MPRLWNERERRVYFQEMHHLYVVKNKSIREIGVLLDLSEKTVYKRLQILEIPINSKLKIGYRNMRKDLHIPQKRSKELAEFFGIMLGDGSLSPFQVKVTLGNKEKSYAEYVSRLFTKLFKTKIKIGIRKEGYFDVYLSSVILSKWFRKEGLVFNKVKSQVGVPKWILSDKKYMSSFIRGFFDTDGSIYKLKYGVQISFCNRSLPILKSLQVMLKKLKYSPSSISLYNMYLTKRADVKRFFEEVKPSNPKHVDRYMKIENNLRRSDSGYSRRL